jgi:putative membrane protein
MDNNIVLEKKLNKLAYVLTFVVLVLVGLMRRYKLDIGVDFSFLPPFHASLNALTAIVLLVALYVIKAKNMELYANRFGSVRSLFVILCCLSFYHPGNYIW